MNIQIEYKGFSFTIADCGVTVEIATGKHFLFACDPDPIRLADMVKLLNNMIKVAKKEYKLK